MTRQLGRKPEDPDYGLGEVSIDGDSLGLLDEQELTERLLRTFESPSYRPPRLPAVAMELMTLSQNPDVDFHEIEALLEQDAMLTGEVLSVARSTFYSRVQQATGLRGALIRLGLQPLRQIVLQAAMNMRIFRSACYRGCMERLQLHSRATAHLARIVSHYTPIAEEQAFVCGLLHDVGIAGILLVLGDTGRDKRPPALAMLWPAIHRAHARAGARMVRLWGLPADVSLAVGAHHQVTVDGYDHPIAATVCLAEALTGKLDMALIPEGDGGSRDTELDLSGLRDHCGIDQSDAVIVERACRSLPVSESVTALILTEAREWFESAANPVSE